MRASLKGAAFANAASWKPLLDALDVAARELAGTEDAELADCTALLDDARLYTELNLKAALATGRSTRPAAAPPGTPWDHATLDTAALQSALDELNAFPRQSEAGVALAVEAKQALAMRTALKPCDWAVPASWVSILTALDAVPPDCAELDEVAASRREVNEVRDSLLAALKAALASGASKPHASPSTAPAGVRARAR